MFNIKIALTNFLSLSRFWKNFFDTPILYNKRVDKKRISLWHAEKKDQKLVQPELHLITPKENRDIIEMCEILQEKASSILVYFRNVQGNKKVIQKVLDYIDLHNTSYCYI